MRGQIRTVLSQEDKSDTNDKERGSRYWTAAEIQTSTWFVVETCFEQLGENVIQRWITTSIHDAVAFEREMAPFNWSHIFVCLRAPLSVRNATIFEVLKEAYQVGRRGTYTYHLENGMTFVTGALGNVITSPDDTQEVRLVYSSRP